MTTLLPVRRPGLIPAGSLVGEPLVGKVDGPTSFGSNSYSGRFSSGNYIKRDVSSGLAAMNMSGKRTVEFWVRFNAATPKNEVLGGFHGVYTDRNYHLHLNSRGAMRAFYYASSGGGYTGVRWSWGPTTKTWYHVAVKIDPAQAVATDKFAWLLNGVDQGAPTVESTGGGSASRVATTGFWSPSIRADGYNPGDFWMDEYRVWDDIRTDAEITNNKDAQIDPSSAKPRLLRTME